MTDVLSEFIEALTILPGIGRKSASRIAFFLLKLPPQQVEELANTIIRARRDLKPCRQCGNLTEFELCAICLDPKRDQSVICVVEEPSDVMAIESAGEYRGLYHVLGGVLSPLDGIGPDDINIASLEQRLKGAVKEVILATNPNAEGEATAAYLVGVLKKYDIRVSRIARGVPMGGFLEYSDKSTLVKAIENRTEIK